jgi:hypothetical protein
MIKSAQIHIHDWTCYYIFFSSIRSLDMSLRFMAKRGIALSSLGSWACPDRLRGPICGSVSLILSPFKYNPVKVLVSGFVIRYECQNVLAIQDFS